MTQDRQKDGGALVDSATTTYNDCRRNFGTEEMLEGLRAGRTLCVDRCDAPELEEIHVWEANGLVTTTLVEIDEQSSVLKVRGTDALLSQRTKP